MKLNTRLILLQRELNITKKQKQYIRPVLLEKNNDVFESSINPEMRALAAKKLSKIHKMTIQEYKKLTEDEKNIIRETIPPQTQKIAKESLVFGLKLKSNLDKNYGVNKYCFLSLGTSPAGIARVMEFSGVETKFIPISRLHNYFSLEKIENLKINKSKYYKFMKSQKITPNDIDKSGKKYLCFDYTISGESINAYRLFLQTIFDMGVNKIKYISINDLIKNIILEENEENEENDVNSCNDTYEITDVDGEKYSFQNYISEYLLKCQMETYCGVPHLNIERINWISKCHKYENINAKKFNFVIIEELDRRGLLKHNSANNSAL